MRTAILIILLSAAAVADSQHYGPKYDSQRPNLEFGNIYKQIPAKPTTPQIFIGAGAPTFAPIKYGDLYISTTTGKVYSSTSTASSGGWAILN